MNLDNGMQVWAVGASLAILQQEMLIDAAQVEDNMISPIQIHLN